MRVRSPRLQALSLKQTRRKDTRGSVGECDVAWFSSVLTGFLGGSDGKESAFSAGDPDSIPRWGGPPGEGSGYPLQYSRL